MNYYLLELKEYLLMNIKSQNPINEEFLKNLISIILKYNDFGVFYKELKIEDHYCEEGETTIVTYGIFSHIITFYMPCFLDITNELQRNLKLRPKEMISLPYLISSEKIIHELDHASQLNREGKNNDLENKILLATSRNKNNEALIKRFAKEKKSKADIDAYFQVREEIYKKYYEFSPRERLTENYSITKCLRLLELLKKWTYLRHLQSYFAYLKYKNLLRGYDRTLNPTKFYMESIHAQEEWQEIEALSGKNLSLHERLKYGLEITKGEYDELLTRKLQIARKI